MTHIEHTYPRRTWSARRRSWKRTGIHNPFTKFERQGNRPHGDARLEITIRIPKPWLGVRDTVSPLGKARRGLVGDIPRE